MQLGLAQLAWWVLWSPVSVAQEPATVYQVISDQRQLEAFSEVVIVGSADVTWTSSRTVQATITADAPVEHAILRVQDGVLHVGAVAGHVDVSLSSVSLSRIEVLGSGDFWAPSVRSPSLEVAVRGSGCVALGGQVEHLVVDVAGSGHVAAGDLRANTVSVEISGSGDVRVLAQQALSIEIAGSGDVIWQGDAELVQSVDGTGLVRRLL